MGKLELVFLQYVDKTPSLAGCAKCHLKFFTPQQLMRQPQAAAEYLREKFARHTCNWEIVEADKSRNRANAPCLNQPTADGATATPFSGCAGTRRLGSHHRRTRAQPMGPVEHLACNLEYFVSQTSFLHGVRDQRQLGRDD